MIASLLAFVMAEGLDLAPVRKPVAMPAAPPAGVDPRKRLLAVAASLPARFLLGVRLGPRPFAIDDGGAMREIRIAPWPSRAGLRIRIRF